MQGLGQGGDAGAACRHQFLRGWELAGFHRIKVYFWKPEINLKRYGFHNGIAKLESPVMRPGLGGLQEELIARAVGLRGPGASRSPLVHEDADVKLAGHLEGDAAGQVGLDGVLFAVDKVKRSRTYIRVNACFLQEQGPGLLMKVPCSNRKTRFLC